MINPDCPHVVPSLDHPDGEYCPKCNGGPCQLSESEALAELVDSECELQVYKPDTSPETIEQGLREGWIQRVGDNSDSHQKPDKPDFSPGSRVWLPMVYYGESIWAEFEIINDTAALDDHIAIGRNEVNGTLVCDSLVVNDWFRERARTQPPENVSDSHINQGFEAFDRAIHAKYSDSHSDSLKRRGSSGFWQECGPYRSKGRTYYRYRWGKGRKIEGVKHIPGGAMTSDLVRNRAYRVYQAVEVEKKPHGEVLELIKSWGRKRNA